VSQQFMLPKHVYEGTDYVTNEANKRPIGTGPMKFGSYTSGQEVVLVKNPDYWGDKSQVDRAVFIAPLPPFLLRTDDNPEGVDQSVFDGFMRSVIADRPAYHTTFLHDFYNLDENLGGRVSEEVVRANWNTAVSASPVATLACIPTWLTDFRQDLTRIDVPALIIQGDADRILPFEVTGQRMHAAVPGSQLITLHGAPHGAPWTHAEEINEALLNFVRTPAEALA